MKQCRNAALVGIVGLISAGLLAGGCSSSSSSGTGKGGSGGGNAGAGGGAGAGGAGGGTGGADAGAVLGCAMSDPPPSMLIADFGGAADGGLSVMGGIATPYGGAAAPTYTTNTGALVVKENAAATSAAQYVGLPIYFNGSSDGKDCLNASAYMGVQFDLSGTATGCMVQYSTNDSAHSDHTTDTVKGAGPAGAYSPQITLTAAQITTAVQTIKIPFTGTGAPSGGMPASAIDPSKLTGIQWQFTIPAGTAATGDGGATDGGAAGGCNATLTIDNISFY
jgi:hypothetical protein